MVEQNLSNIGSDIPGNLAPKDANARREEKSLYGDDKRAHQKKQAIHYLFIVAIFVLVIVVLGLFVCRALQSVLPSGYCWLTTEQIKYVDDFVAHGALGGLLVGFGKKIADDHINPKNKKDDDSQEG